MEGTGLYVSADNNRIDWIIIKSICDWGYDKRKDFQVLAANASASLVHFVLNNPNSLSDLGISSINNNTC